MFRNKIQHIPFHLAFQHSDYYSLYRIPVGNHQTIAAQATAFHPSTFFFFVGYLLCVCLYYSELALEYSNVHVRWRRVSQTVSLNLCAAKHTHHTVVLIAITLNLLGKLKRVILRWLAHRVFLLYSSQQYNRFSSLWFSLSFRRSHSSIFHSIEREWWVTEVGRSNRLTVPSRRLL